MPKSKETKFRLSRRTRELLYILSRKHQCTKSELMRKLIIEKAELELVLVRKGALKQPNQ